jgi:hypothetical protein
MPDLCVCCHRKGVVGDAQLPACTVPGPLGRNGTFGLEWLPQQSVNEPSLAEAVVHSQMTRPLHVLTSLALVVFAVLFDSYVLSGPNHILALSLSRSSPRSNDLLSDLAGNAFKAVGDACAGTKGLRTFTAIASFKVHARNGKHGERLLVNSSKLPKDEAKALSPVCCLPLKLHRLWSKPAETHATRFRGRQGVLHSSAD